VEALLILFIEPGAEPLRFCLTGECGIRRGCRLPSTGGEREKEHGTEAVKQVLV
jgi:hypothetical protein